MEYRIVMLILNMEDAKKGIKDFKNGMIYSILFITVILYYTNLVIT